MIRLCSNCKTAAARAAESWESYNPPKYCCNQCEPHNWTGAGVIAKSPAKDGSIVEGKVVMFDCTKNVAGIETAGGIVYVAIHTLTKDPCKCSPAVVEETAGERVFVIAHNDQLRLVSCRQINGNGSFQAERALGYRYRTGRETWPGTIIVYTDKVEERIAQGSCKQGIDATYCYEFRPASKGRLHLKGFSDQHKITLGEVR